MGALFSEWAQGSGAWQLAGPDIPTYALGATIDKFLFLPGYYIPSTLPPIEGPRFLDHEVLADYLHYPAFVLDCPHVSDHSPILLPAPCDSQDRLIPAPRRPHLGHPTSEEWMERDARQAQMLMGKLPGSTGAE